ncbi:hypothetical protein [Rhodoblastus sp.]|jgi:hypothetical protein|uniref:hypothetical protein n=1 Tax=Rhodoblastus sp. TaxID=1962975 RepID=UPI0026010BD2|nr:hypothetical protein [Rhodoblastus sp.]
MLSVQSSEQPSRVANAPIFQCAKAKVLIPVRNRLVRDALIQTALDPEVTDIRPPEAEECSFDFRAARCSVEERVYVRSNADEEDELAGGDCDVVLHEPIILSEPRLTSARLVWSCRKRWVPPGDRVRVLHFLTEGGAAPLIDVAQAATSSPDGVAAVLALVCQDLLEIDLAQASLAPEMLVRRRYQVS